MRRLVLPLLVLVALALVSSAVAAPLFVVTGRGWGHGVGMSQWGAYGMVLRAPATTHQQILGHYYPGTAVERRANVTVRVLLATGASSATIGSAAPFKANSKVIPAGNYTVTPANNRRIRVVGVGRFASPVRFSAGTRVLELANKPYRGHLDVRRRSGGLQVRNALGREVYLRGVVPGEVPASWPAAVLRAQAVAARSWLMRSLDSGRWFDVYDDTRSQVYGGVWEEELSTNQAVADTKNEVLTYAGAVAQAFYHSSSGGRTAASIDVWGGDVPYLKSVHDSDLHAYNPNRRWSFTLSASGLAARLGTRTPADATLTRDRSGLAQRLTVTRPGWSASVRGSETLRFRMQARSARFRIGVLSLEPARKKITYGSSVAVRGIARRGGTAGWGSAYVERSRTGSWSALGSALPNGTWSRSYRPRRSADYRVRSGNAVGYAARVAVVTKVRFYAPQAPYRKLEGFITPARGSVAVKLQQKGPNGRWGTVTTASTGSDGKFTFVLPAGGTYRASADAGSGLLVGYTPPLTIG